MKTEFLQYTITRRRDGYIQTQVDFTYVNSGEVFLIARVFQIKSEKHLKMKIACEKACEYLKLAVCDFAKINADIHPVLAQKFNLPTLEPAPVFTEGYQDKSLGATNFSELGFVFKRANNNFKYFIPNISMHQLTRRQLEVTLTSVQKMKHTTHEVKFEITSRIT